MTLNRGFTYRARVAGTARGQTLVAWLSATYTHSPLAEWAKRLARAEVALDGRVATGDETLRAGQEVAWMRPPWHEAEVPLTFDLVHEDAHVVAVAKPSGLPTMPAGGFLDHTLLALVRARFGTVHPAHRLGRFTSGLVLFARTRPAAATLAAAWRSHEVTKDYRALVVGRPRLDEARHHDADRAGAARRGRVGARREPDGPRGAHDCRRARTTR